MGVRACVCAERGVWVRVIFGTMFYLYETACIFVRVAKNGGVWMLVYLYYTASVGVTGCLSIYLSIQLSI